jgi:ABC-type transport system involved in cytochrome c biogenesis permease subunit
MSRSSVYVGLGALAVGVISGLIWEHRLTGAFALGDPKVVVTLLIVAAYVAYLVLSRSTRWRGARAAWICALNFAVVLFSYTIVNLYLTTFHRFF